MTAAPAVARECQCAAVAAAGETDEGSQDHGEQKHQVQDAWSRFRAGDGGEEKASACLNHRHGRIHRNDKITATKGPEADATAADGSERWLLPARALLSAFCAGRVAVEDLTTGCHC